MQNDPDQKAENQELVSRWHEEIKLYDKEFNSWEGRAKKVVERYLDERRLNDSGLQVMEGERFNILWSNVETILPAVYARTPKADVSRRYKDSDPVGRVAAIMLERCLDFENEQYSDFNSALLNVLYDRLVPGRGVAWVRYEPTFIQVPANPALEAQEEAEDDDEQGEPEGVEIVPTTGQITEDAISTIEKLDHECTPIDYVHWKDFGHVVATRWEEVPGVWRKVYLTKDKVRMRFEQSAQQFGYDVNEIPLDHEIERMKNADGTISDYHKRATIYEVWDKDTKKVIWLHEDLAYPLDVRDDPLKLEDFFPCPKPLLATTGTGSLVPVPDYIMYQDQARELDIISQRIQRLQEAIKIVGVYDATQEGVKRMLNEGVNNTLIPVDSWAVFAEKGGIKGVVEFLPLDSVINALKVLYEVREQIKGVIYEVTGLSDIIRGSSVASETATAQQIKANFASIRIRRLQAEIAEFARDLTRKKAQVICNLYSPQTILQMAGVSQFNQQDQMLVPQALQILKSDVLREFRVDIETDSMVQIDENEDKQSRVEFMQAVAGFLQQAVPAAQMMPEMTPVLGELLMFVVRGFKVSKNIEGIFDQAMAMAKQKAQQPDPRQQMQQQKMQMDQEKMHAENVRSQANAMGAVAKARADMAQSNNDVAISAMEHNKAVVEHNIAAMQNNAGGMVPMTPFVRQQ